MKPKLLPQDIDLLRRTVTEALSDDEHALFVRACERSGLDPFARHLYWIRDRGKFELQATIDGFRWIAEQSAKYAGQVGPEWCGPDGVWRDIWTEKQPPTAARVGILRTDFEGPIWGKALFAEFSQDGDFWRGMPANQLAKCAEALGFRKAFPQQLAGLYTTEELRSANVQSISGSPVRSSDRSEPEGGGPPPRVPAPLQPFVDAGMDPRNVAAANAFIAGELEHKLGDAGRGMFRSTMARYRRAYKTREEARAATIHCWCEMWAALESAGKEREAA